MLNYSQDLIFCLGGENQPPYHTLGNGHAHNECNSGDGGVHAYMHTHPHMVSQSVSQ